MKSYEEIRNNNQNGTFYAIGSDGKKYAAAYSAKFCCMFFCIPSHVTVLGYIKR